MAGQDRQDPGRRLIRRELDQKATRPWPGFFIQGRNLYLRPHFMAIGIFTAPSAKSDIRNATISRASNGALTAIGMPVTQINR